MILKRLRKLILKIGRKLIRKRESLILVYTMSKVGSTSVYQSLKKSLPNTKIKHLHFLGETWLKKFETDHKIFQENIRNAQSFYKLADSGDYQLKIISLVRDPIARDISGIFQTWQHLFDYPNITDVPLDELLEFLSKQEFQFAENWFKTDFYEFTGINVLDEQFRFNAEEGFQIYRIKKASLLIIQLERLDEVYVEAMNLFFGIGEYELLKMNITANKDYAKYNQLVKNKFGLSKERLSQIYDTAYVNKFYSKEQIEEFIQKWANS